MSEDTRLSLRILDERIKVAVEQQVRGDEILVQIIDAATNVDKRLKVVEDSGGYEYEGPGPDYFEDILVAVINALFGLRSAGAYHLAKGLEEKYFDGKDVKRVGDRITSAQDLYSSSAEKSKE